MERKVKEGGGSLLTKRIDLRRSREQSPSVDPSSVSNVSRRVFCPRSSNALSPWKSGAASVPSGEGWMYTTVTTVLPPGPAARFSFFNSGRKTFYNDLLGNRFLLSLLREGAHLCAKLSFSLSLSFFFSLTIDNFAGDTRWFIHIPSVDGNVGVT